MIKNGNPINFVVLFLRIINQPNYLFTTMILFLSACYLRRSFCISREELRKSTGLFKSAKERKMMPIKEQKQKKYQRKKNKTTKKYLLRERLN